MESNNHTKGVGAAWVVVCCSDGCVVIGRLSCRMLPVKTALVWRS